VKKPPFGKPRFGKDRKPFGEKPFRRRPDDRDSRGADRGEQHRPREEGPAPRRERPHLAENELHYHGKNACLALYQQRPQDLIRVYVLRDLAEEYSELLEYCAKNRKAYHLVGPRDLERLTDSVHHQGICLVARAQRSLREDQFFRELGGGRSLVMYLDGVGNPHNLGAILRTAAHFGVKHLCVPQESVGRLSPAIFRTAEGGAEFVSVVRIEDTEKFLDRLQGMGFHLYAFDPAASSQSLFDTRLNERSAFVFGAEVEGLSGLVRTIVETKLSIPGTGAVESLNVSVAAALAMAEFQKQGTQRAVRIVKSRS
jgi:RNA methyltransferase, TrmH family